MLLLKDRDDLSARIEQKKINNIDKKKFSQQRLNTKYGESTETIINSVNEILHETKFREVIKRYREGTHLDPNLISNERNDIELEAKMYAEALTILKDCQHLADCKGFHIGDLQLPLETLDHTKTLENQKKYIKEAHAKKQMFDKFLVALKEAQKISYSKQF